MSLILTFLALKNFSFRDKNQIENPSFFGIINSKDFKDFLFIGLHIFSVKIQISELVIFLGQKLGYCHSVYSFIF